uniref:Uncharacterized protein n=1 Tax=Anguilla anguilla TaxID=7936 RepID=A0A0E9VJI5_ANGAN
MFYEEAIVSLLRCHLLAKNREALGPLISMQRDVCSHQSNPTKSCVQSFGYS